MRGGAGRPRRGDAGHLDGAVEADEEAIVGADGVDVEAHERAGERARIGKWLAARRRIVARASCAHSLSKGGQRVQAAAQRAPRSLVHGEHLTEADLPAREQRRAVGGDEQRLGLGARAASRRNRRARARTRAGRRRAPRRA